MRLNHSIWLPAVAALALPPCHARPPAAAPTRTAAPPPAATARPPAPPAPPAAAARPAPARLSDADLFARKSLDELNAERPLNDVFFDYDQNALRDEARRTL